MTQRNGPRHATCSARHRLHRHFTSILRSDLTREFPVSDVTADGRGAQAVANQHRLRKDIVRSVRPACRFGDGSGLTSAPNLEDLPLRLYLELPGRLPQSEWVPPTLHIPNRVHIHIYLPLVRLKRLTLYPMAPATLPAARLSTQTHRLNKKSIINLGHRNSCKYSVSPLSRSLARPVLVRPVLTFNCTTIPSRTRHLHELAASSSRCSRFLGVSGFCLLALVVAYVPTSLFSLVGYRMIYYIDIFLATYRECVLHKKS